jgi:hypothetical protein
LATARDPDAPLAVAGHLDEAGDEQAARAPGPIPALALLDALGQGGCPLLGQPSVLALGQAERGAYLRSGELEVWTSPGLVDT